MNHDHFPYVYDKGRWLHDDEQEEGLTLRSVVEAVLCCITLGVCLTALAMLGLCM